MIYFTIAIVLLTIIETYYVNDLSNVFRLNGIITIAAGYITIILNYFLRNIITQRISFINTSKITDLVFRKAVNKGLILILIGGVELIVFIIIYVYKKRRIINR